jgi:hypothetical protein
LFFPLKGSKRPTLIFAFLLLPKNGIELSSGGWLGTMVGSFEETGEVGVAGGFILPLQELIKTTINKEKRILVILVFFMLNLVD